MTARRRALAGVLIMSVLLVLYFGFAGVRAFALLQSQSLISIAMGVALVVLPLLGAWALLRELQFGYRSTALVDQLETENLLPNDLGEVGATGKPDRDVADQVFGKYKEATENEPANWRNWLRLGIVYDACGDRTRARGAIREAISRHRDEIR